MPNACKDVLDFWFGAYVDEVQCASQQSALWWGKNSQMDRQIQAMFESDLRALAQGRREDWLQTSHGRLAAIIVLDQFSRNIYRGTPQAFANDSQALQLCEEGLAMGADRQLRPLQRVFFYLPLEHSESLAQQVRCVTLFETLKNNVALENRMLFSDYLDFAQRHKAIIEQFGRFPHRNAVLGRQSTPEETQFLKQPGSAF